MAECVRARVCVCACARVRTATSSLLTVRGAQDGSQVGMGGMTDKSLMDSLKTQDYLGRTMSPRNFLPCLRARARATYAIPPLSVYCLGIHRRQPQCLARRGPLSTDMYNVNQLHLMAAAGDEAGLTATLKQSADVDAPDVVGRTALCYAAVSGAAGAAQLLLQAGANPRAADVDGRSPCHWAAFHGKEKVVKILVARDTGKWIYPTVRLSWSYVEIMASTEHLSPSICHGNREHVSINFSWP